MRELEREAVATFETLLVPRGYRRFKTDRSRWATTVSFVGKEIGIEVALDWREYRADTLVFELPLGKSPVGRQYFALALKALGIAEPSPLPGKLQGAQTVREDLAFQVELIGRHLDLIEARANELFHRKNV